MTFDDELLQDAQDDAQAVEYIKRHLPQELQEKFNDETLYYMLDLTEEYFAQSGVLDAQPDEDGYVDIDLEEIAAHLEKQAKKEGFCDFSKEELLFFVQAELDFEERQEN